MDAINYLRISVTSECNENCWYCYNEGLDKEKILLSDIEGFKWLINNIICHYGVKIVRFTGGEPLLNPKITSLIEIVKNSSTKVIGLTTNGVLLPNYYKEINRIAQVQYSVHIYQIDKYDCNIDDIVQFISHISSIVKSVRFNIVVTKSNIEIIKLIVKYTIEHNINLLLLELLQAKNDFETFSNNHCSLDEIKHTLHDEFGLSCTRQNKNSNIYSNGKMSIKVVESYVNGTNFTEYCTKNLSYNPVIISSDFTMMVCNHFGKKAFQLKDAVKSRDETQLYFIVDKALKYLLSCNECKRCEILTDYLYDLS